jgi:hypothetical protein
VDNVVKVYIIYLIVEGNLPFNCSASMELIVYCLLHLVAVVERGGWGAPFWARGVVRLAFDASSLHVESLCERARE